MNKIYKYVFGCTIAICLVIIFILGITDSGKSQKVVDGIVENVLESSENILLFVGSSECEKCKYQAKEFSILHDMYELGYYYLDLDDIKITSKKNKILTDLGFNINSGVELPSLAVYKDGKMIDSISGLNGLDDITVFLNKNGIAEINDFPFTFHDISSYQNLMEKKEKKIFVVSTYSNDEAIEFQSIIASIASEYKLNINILYLDDITQDEYNIVYNSNKFFQDYVVDITTIVIFDENNNVLGYSLDVLTKEEYIDILKNASIINN